MKIKLVLLILCAMGKLFLISQNSKDTIYNIDNNKKDRYHFLDELVKNKKVISLGEISHQDGTTFIHKTELIKYLHEKHGFNIVAFESAFDQIEITNLYNHNYNNIDTLKSQLFSHWKNVEETKLLFDYMKKENMVLTGFDSQHYKNNCNISDSIVKYFSFNKTNPYYTSNFIITLNVLLNNFGKSHKMISDENKKSFINTLDNLIRNSSEFINKSIISDFWVQELYSIKGNALSSWSIPNYMLGFNIRDEYMAKNLLWLINTKYSNQKIIIWAHSVHVCRNRYKISTPKEKSFTAEKYLGDYLYESLNDEIYSISFINNKLNNKSKRTNSSLENKLGLIHEFAYTETLSNKKLIVNAFYENEKKEIDYWNIICNGFYFINNMHNSKKTEQ